MSPYESTGDIVDEGTEGVAGDRYFDAGRVIGREAAELTGVSLRQTRRLLAACRQKDLV